MTFPEELARPFRLIAFDWDGTAVTDRSADATGVRRVIERLLRAGVRVVVITGTNFQNIDRQLSSAIRGPHKRKLFVAANRGSEVYGFDARCAPIVLSKRAATPDEERLLTQVADALRDELGRRTGLEIGVVYDRLNRRKIDLIPIPDWDDPPKARLGELADAVEARLVNGGLSGGLREAFDLAARIARESGLADPRITSDVKHIEVGLTDKSDSIVWTIRELARPAHIGVEDVLLAGDEFGPVAGFAGSDSRMLVPEAKGAVVVSVGPEPGGVPPPVLGLGGGPARFQELLAAQAALHPIGLPAAPTESPEWRLEEDGFVLTREHEVESLFAIGNGYVGSRGALAEGTALSSPATFVAGVFEARGGDARPELAVLPEWVRVAATVNGQPIRLDTGENIHHRRLLDLRQGILWRDWRFRDAVGRVTHVRGLRLASLADRHVLFQSITLSPENYRGTLSVEGGVTPASVMQTNRGVRVAVATSSILEQPAALDTGVGAASGETDAASDKLVPRWQLDVEIGRTYRLDRVFVAYTSRDTPSPMRAAQEHLAEIIAARGVEGVLEEHCRAWRERWRASDVRVEGDAAAQRALRFAAYHLLSAANPDDEGVSIGARALTGGTYMGHVFWDTEVFMLPFFTLTWPAAARALLLYRHRTLPAARAKAARLGYRGALYAWESADTGDEASPTFVLAPDGSVVPLWVGTKEQHVSADIAFGTWSYWQATGDDAFLRDAGAEILLETARFWASRAAPGSDGLWHIQDVIGPDEYHDAVDDNAYTNVMAQWNLERGAEVAALLAERWPDRARDLFREIGLEPEEREEWLRIAARMYTGFRRESGLFEQFRGYFDLEEIDLSGLAGSPGPADLLLGRERTRRSRVIKQADVVMLLFLLWDRFPPEVREANFRFYEPRTAHGSSLSPPVHALVAARLGDLPLAARYFRRTADIDLARLGGAASGVHAAALGGLWQAAVFGFAGMRLGPAGPTLDPRLPPAWRRMEFAVQWRGRTFDLTAAPRHAAGAVVAEETEMRP